MREIRWEKGQFGIAVTKKSMIFSAVIAVIAGGALAFAYYLKGQNEFYMSGTDKITVVCLAGAAILLALVRITLPQWLEWLCTVLMMGVCPYLVFHKFERIVNDFSTFKEEAAQWNILILFLIFLLVYGIVQIPGVAISFAMVLCYLVYVVDYFVIAFRGTPVLVSDILSARTAFGVASRYSYVLCNTIVVGFYIVLLICVLSFQLRIKIRKRLLRLLNISVPLIVSAAAFWVLFDSSVLEEAGFSNDAYVPITAADANGLFLNALVNARKGTLEKPEGYSSDAVLGIMEQYDQTAVLPEDQQYPNIIVIMSESFTDLNYLGQLVTSEEVMPFFDSIDENVVRGTLISSVYGGNTPNSEFEFLTGSSMAYLPSGSVAYQQTISRELSTIPSMLKELGYTTEAIHLYNQEYFDRRRIYPLFGFDHFESIETIDPDKVTYLRWLPTDKSSFDAIIEAFEAKEAGVPQFTFCVTIQNHAGYGGYLMDIVVENITDSSDTVGASEYCSLLRISDEALEYLLDYFSDVEEPVIVCFYGDHQPYMGQSTYDTLFEGCDYTEEEMRYLKAKVPFLIWANYDIGYTELGEMSINYLGPLLLETAGLPLSGYFQFLTDLQQKFPVVSGIGYVDNEGNYLTDYSDHKYAEFLQQYSYLQYNYLKDSVNRDFYELNIN